MPAAGTEARATGTFPRNPLIFRKAGKRYILQWLTKSGVGHEMEPVKERIRVELRPVCAEDREFLYALYRTTRARELDAWGWDEAQRGAFLEMQFKAQAHSYAAQYPDAENSIVMLDGFPAGRMIVARDNHALLLVDIAVLPQHQGAGIGSRLLCELMDRAAAESLGLRVSVLVSNSGAVRLYERLGLRRTGGDELYSRMEWKPPGEAE